MKKLNHFGIFMLLTSFLAISISTFAQKSGDNNKCKVLHPGISGKYTGECKKGLAHGLGKAEGTDTYEGEFKKGLPSGKGIYKWADGTVYDGEWKKGLCEGYGEYSFFYSGKDSIIAGYWQKDKYIGEKPRTVSYKVIYKDNIGRINFKRFGDGRKIRLKLIRNGAETGVPNLMLNGNSGTVILEISHHGFTGFENVLFPFTGKILFSAPNAFYATTLNYELRFEINEPGFWEINIHF